MTTERYCLDCGAVLHGRADKKFCNDQCRNNYNNQLNSVTGQAKWMQYIFPIMLLGIFNNLPAALTYYYFLSNVITFVLQWVVQNYFLDHAAIHKQIQERKKQPPKKKSGFLARLEEMQREQAKKRG